MEMEGYELPDAWPSDPDERGRLATFLERVAAHYADRAPSLDAHLPPEHAAMLHAVARRFAVLWPAGEERPAVVAAFVGRFAGDGPVAA